MLLNCPTCKAQYLVNSADLLEEGRIVKCIKCKYQWFQNPNLDNNINIEYESIKTNKKINNYSKTLPSTYVEPQKSSITNSLFMVIFIISILFLYFFLKNLDSGIMNLIIFYIKEFIDNINLIIQDFSKALYNIIN